MTRYKVRTYTGPTLVNSVAAHTELEAGTQHVYGTIEAQNAMDARAIVIKRFAMAKLWTPRHEDITVRSTKRQQESQCQKS